MSCLALRTLLALAATTPQEPELGGGGGPPLPLGATSKISLAAFRFETTARTISATVSCQIYKKTDLIPHDPRNNRSLAPLEPYARYFEEIVDQKLRSVRYVCRFSKNCLQMYYMDKNDADVHSSSKFVELYNC